MSQNLVSVDFYGEKVFLAEWHGEPYVPVKPICENLGLDWAGQFRKLKAESRRWQLVSIPQRAGKAIQDMLCLPLRKLPAWLMSISPSKVKPEVRDKLIRYQEECDKVLWDYWFRGIAVNHCKVQPSFDFGEPLSIPPVRYECRGYVTVWYYPVDLLAHVLRLASEDILSLLNPGEYLENPEITGYFRKQFPMYAGFIRSDIIVFDTGIRRLFVKNLIAEKNGKPVSEELKLIEKVIKAVERLEKSGIPIRLALKLIRARLSGMTQEEVAKAFGLNRNKVQRIEYALKEINFWSLVEKILPVPA